MAARCGTAFWTLLVQRMVPESKDTGHGCLFCSPSETRWMGAGGRWGREQISRSAAVDWLGGPGAVAAAFTLERAGTGQGGSRS